jgi:hypothetical protein
MKSHLRSEFIEQLSRAVESEWEVEGILGGVGVGKKCTDSDFDLNLKS